MWILTKSLQLALSAHVLAAVHVSSKTCEASHCCNRSWAREDAQHMDSNRWGCPGSVVAVFQTDDFKLNIVKLAAILKLFGSIWYTTLIALLRPLAQSSSAGAASHRRWSLKIEAGHRGMVWPKYPVYPAVYQVKHADEPPHSSYFACQQEWCRAERMKAASSVTGRFDLASACSRTSAG